MPTHPVDELASIVRDIAQRELVPRFACHSGKRKSDGSLVTEADLLNNHALVTALKERWPEYALLSEEFSDATQQAALDQRDQGVWCIDPLDGTNNFSAGIPYYAVSIALIISNQAVYGVVYDPSRDECFTAIRGSGAWLNGQRLQPPAPKTKLADSMALIDLKRLRETLARRLVIDPPYSSQRSFGAVALDWCWLAAGRCDIYLHGGQKLWDYAAGSLVLMEAGGKGCTLEGEPLFKPSLETRSAAAALDAGIYYQWKHWLGIQ